MRSPLRGGLPRGTKSNHLPVQGDGNEPQTFASQRLMHITLTVTKGQGQGRTFTFNGHDTFLVGRSRHAHLQLSPTDRYCSRIHFMVEVNPPSCRLMDMGSNNGTHVNGARVTRAEL